MKEDSGEIISAQGFYRIDEGINQYLHFRDIILT